MCVGSVGELCECEDTQRFIVKLRDYSGENVVHKLFMLACSYKNSLSRAATILVELHRIRKLPSLFRHVRAAAPLRHFNGLQLPRVSVSQPLPQLLTVVN